MPKCLGCVYKSWIDFTRKISLKDKIGIFQVLIVFPICGNLGCEFRFFFFLFCKSNMALRYLSKNIIIIYETGFGLINALYF